MIEEQITQRQVKFLKIQNRLFYWTLIAFAIFVISWIAGIYRHLFGFDPHWAGDNFVFNFTFLFPVTFICLLIMFFTGGLTILNWKSLPNLVKKIVTIILSYGLLFYVAHYILTLLRQH